MMANKDHNEYMSYFKDVETLTTIDIPNQPNSIKGKALKSKLITRYIVSTDDEEIQQVAIQCGAEAPFLRPQHRCCRFYSSTAVTIRMSSSQGMVRNKEACQDMRVDLSAS